jgi:polyphosphate kinase
MVAPELPAEAFVNRELSWLEFNRRVLEEAQDPAVPLLERVKFLAIFSSNLDEFFMVRVAMLKRHIRAGDRTASPDGLTPAATLAAVAARVHELVETQHRCFLNSRRTSTSSRSSIAISSTPASSTSAMAAIRNICWPRPTGCRATWTGGWRSPSPCWIHACKPRSARSSTSSSPIP